MSDPADIDVWLELDDIVVDFIEDVIEGDY